MSETFTYIWKVTGHVATESGTGGPETWVYHTHDRLTLPDLTQPFFRPGSKNERSWYLIESIVCIGSLQNEEFIGGNGPWCWDDIPQLSSRPSL